MPQILEVTFATPIMSDPEEPEDYHQARWHQDHQEQEKWRQAIWKELSNTIGCKVWKQ